jgi:hypothetical protein
VLAESHAAGAGTTGFHPGRILEVPFTAAALAAG